MSDASLDTERLNLREQIARIDNLIGDTQKKQREYHMQPWQVCATLLGGAAAFFAIPEYSACISIVSEHDLI